MSGTDIVSCFANGVKDLVNPSGTVVTRKKANGDLCLTVAVVAGQTQDFSDAQGNPVAHLQSTGSTTQYVVTCAGSGTSTNVDLTSAACTGYSNAQACTTGACTW